MLGSPEKRNSVRRTLLSAVHAVLCRCFRTQTNQMNKKKGRMYINKGIKKEENWQSYERDQTEP